ncbi:MAG: hypothetical protein DCF15_13495 [Phormidesmis priestleyi]|uniref:Uncharacterized protein n=1 Tax=Phormidesmis priestleyi TaxID=268141 RepID=A0A2W4X647_9CYAN|nr:MAG: hypothetical protein DCF15_13495 [Phormidesmis priestleyi]
MDTAWAGASLSLMAQRYDKTAHSKTAVTKNRGRFTPKIKNQGLGPPAPDGNRTLALFIVWRSLDSRYQLS